MDRSVAAVAAMVLLVGCHQPVIDLGFVNRCGFTVAVEQPSGGFRIELAPDERAFHVNAAEIGEVDRQVLSTLDGDRVEVTFNRSDAVRAPDGADFDLAYVIDAPLCERLTAEP